MNAGNSPRPSNAGITNRSPNVGCRSHLTSFDTNSKCSLIYFVTGEGPPSWHSTDRHMPPVMLVETLNAKRTWVVPMDQLAAVHRCLGRYDGPTHPAEGVKQSVTA